MNWRSSSDTAELDARRVFPVKVLVAAWYDGQFGSTFVCEARYQDGRFGDPRGGTLGQCVVTHWKPMPEPPNEQEMLDVALGSLGLARTAPADEYSLSAREQHE